MRDVFADLARRFAFQKSFRFAPGGEERQDSVWNGLLALSEAAEIVLIQDGARPCTSPEVIRQTIEAARVSGAAVSAQRVTDTIKESDGGTRIARTLDRQRLWSVQTPQTFRLEVIRKALQAVRQKNLSVTDDTAACECIGQPVTLVENRAPNPKVTSAADLPLVESLLRQQLSTTKVLP
jgi:2-C-methyl-D-erythritol 4-phosphate cytidylyltransferase